jgi:hypothetical protein
MKIPTEKKMNPIVDYEHTYIYLNEMQLYCTIGRKKLEVKLNIWASLEFTGEHNELSTRLPFWQKVDFLFLFKIQFKMKKIIDLEEQIYAKSFLHTLETENSQNKI